ncbi:MAG: prepilin-type N-terminal cleavage/methylation domain-containing protein [Planctomycetes bacterium]|nr:prepilin-type N-terminal cleavage/methylation domain-containing protein [Planctomycetota bacterium]
MKNTIRHSTGFTLMEIMVVVMIIGIIVTMLIPSLQSAQDRAKEAWCKNNMRQIAGALSQYSNQFAGFIPQDREWTDAQWYPQINLDVIYYGTKKGFSWQQILDKILEAPNNNGLLYTLTPDYVINGDLINMRGVSGVFKDAMSGYGSGTYVGSSQVFVSRTLPNGTFSTGPVCIHDIVAQGGKLDVIPAIADGTRANSDDLWARRYRKPFMLTGTSLEKPHTEVTGRFSYVPLIGSDAGKEFLNIDFRHRNKAIVLYLDSHMTEWRIGENVLGSGWKGPFLTQTGGQEISTPGSDLYRMRAQWDTMFYGVSP